MPKDPYAGVNKTIDRASLLYILRELPLPAFITAADGRIMTVNAAFSRLSGYTSDQLVDAQPPYGFWPAPALTFEHQGGRPELIRDQTMLTQDGRELRGDFKVVPVTGGRQSGWCVVTFLAGSRETQLADELIKTENRFETVFNAIPFPLTISILPDLSIIKVNRALLQVGDLRQPEDILGHTAYEMNWFSAEEREKYTGIMINEPELSENEISYRKNNGDLQKALLRTRHIKLDGVEYLLTASIDISHLKKTEEALRESEAFNRSLLDYSANPILVSENDGRIKYVNPALEKLTGYSAVEITGIFPPYPWWPPDMVTEYLQQSRMDSQNEKIESRYISKDGRTFWVSASHCLIQEQAKIKRYLSNWVDITESKITQEALRLSEQNFHESIEKSPLGIRIINLQGDTLFANKAFLDLYGFSTIEEFNSVPTRQRYTRASYLAFLERRRRRKANLPVPGEYELDIVRKDKSIRHLLISRGEVIWNNQRQYQVIYRDITEKTLAEKSLQESEAKYRTLFETMAQGVVSYDSRGRIVYANPAARTILGLSFDEMRRNALRYLKKARIREDGSEILPDEMPARVALKSGRKISDYVIGVYNPVDKKYRWINVNAIPVKHAGDKKPRGVELTFADITAVKEAQALAFETEALKIVNRTKTDLLANVSHELRTPLASIKGCIESLIESDVKWSRAQQMEFLQSANQETDRLTFLIRDLLDMSRLDAGRMPIDKQKVTVQDILETARNVLEIVAKDHQLHIQTASGLPCLQADKNRIAQVINNLVENACKFSTPGSRVDLSVKQMGEHIEFSVKDRGIGISEETMSHLFDRFYQAQMVVTGKTRGTGLGLAIAKGIVESHDGRFKVSSQLHKGSLFSFSLPVSDEYR